MNKSKPLYKIALNEQEGIVLESDRVEIINNKMIAFWNGIQVIGLFHLDKIQYYVRMGKVE